MKKQDKVVFIVSVFIWTRL